jgi:hypothetical protein
MWPSSCRAAAKGVGAADRCLEGGKLAERGKPDQFQGAYAEIVRGVNDILDAVIGPLNVSAKYVELISKGDIPAAITDTYNGDFNTDQEQPEHADCGHERDHRGRRGDCQRQPDGELRERSPQDKLMQALASMVAG